MVLSFVFIAFLLLGCTQVERDNPYDPDGINYNPDLVKSSSSVEPTPSSSSSETLSSSSGAVSSSSYGGLCTGFDPEAQVEHYGKMKKQFCDERDGKKYVYVTIGEQTWMAENLNYEASESKCYGDDTGGDSQGNCVKYGRLYYWETAMNNSASSYAVPSGVRGICPDGWHLPSPAEWNLLITGVGGDNTAGKKLKSVTGWNTGSNYKPGTDDYGFSALPGGQQSIHNGSFINAGSIGNWWSSARSSVDEYTGVVIANLSMNNNRESALWTTSNHLGSVRCVQD